MRPFLPVLSFTCSNISIFVFICLNLCVRSGKHNSHNNRKKKNLSILLLTMASLVCISSEADEATFWMIGAMLVGP